jgi:thioredoxin-related protein
MARVLVAALLAAGPTLGGWIAAGPARGEAPAAPIINDDGLYTQPWFLTSFLDLKQDLAESHAAKKRLAVIWEQRGCPYCKEMHTVNFARPEINRYVRENFNVIQLNLWGDREVTDFDGKALSEKDLAKKWGILFTPTIQFFPETPAETGGKPGNTVEVARMPGLFRPHTFLGMFRYVREKRYGDTHFQKYLLELDEALRKQGQAVPEH